MTISARVNSNMVITDSVGNFKYDTPNQRGNFIYTFVSASPNGPVPGAILVPTAGVDIDLSQLTTPGLAEIFNLEVIAGYYVEYGIRYLGEFFCWGEVAPGENYVWKFSRHLQIRSGTGTGSASTGTGVKVHLKAHPVACRVALSIFDK